MAPLSLKYVVSFSSQDAKNPVENVLNPDSSKKWLSASSDKTGQLEAVFQLERSIVISHIDIGSYWVFTLQLLVGRSSWPQDKKFISLFPSCVCMEPADCKKGLNKAAMKLFKQGDFDVEARKEPWDRLQVVCSQPFRKDVQFGLSLLRIIGEDSENQENIPVSTIPKQINLQESKLDNSQTSLLEIKKHFFGEETNRKQQENNLKSKLSKIGASSEIASQNEAALSRNVKLVVAAAAKLPKYKTHDGTEAATSSVLSLNQKKKVDIEEETRRFFGTLNVKCLDLEKLTFADLRHRLEKQKLRKLSKEEKKVFFKLAQEFVEQAVNSDVSSGPSFSSNDKGKLQVTMPMCKQTPEVDTERGNATIAADLNCTTPRSQMKKQLENLSLLSPVRTSMPKSTLQAAPMGNPSDGSCRAKTVKPSKLVFTKTVKGMVPTTMVSPLNHSKSRKHVAPASPAGCSLTSASLNSSPTAAASVSPSTHNVWLSKSSTNDLRVPNRTRRVSGHTPRQKQRQSNSCSSVEGIDTAVTATQHIGKKERGSKARKGKHQTTTQPCKRKRSMDSESSQGEDDDCMITAEKCPLCGVYFPANEIKMHAAQCGFVETLEADKPAIRRSPTPDGAYGYSVPDAECPICNKMYPAQVLPLHADQCASIYLD